MLINLEREEGKGGCREREREKHWCEKHRSAASHVHPDWGSNPKPFVVWDDTPINWATRPGTHMYTLINVFIWISNKHLNLNISKTVLPHVHTKYVPLARLTTPAVAQAKTLRAFLYPSVFSISHIQSNGKLYLHNVSPTALHHPYCRQAGSSSALPTGTSSLSLCPPLPHSILTPWLVTH